MVISNKIVYIAASIYQYTMPAMTLAYLVIVPWVSKYQYSNSLFVDRVAQCILFAYFVFGYTSASIAIKKMINKKAGYSSEMNKDFMSFGSLSISAVGSAVVLFILTRSSMIAFAPYLSGGLIFFVSLLNSFIYAVLILLQYYFLPEI